MGDVTAFVATDLSISYAQLREEIAKYMWGTRDIPTDSAKLATIEEYVRSGLRKFYWPVQITAPAQDGQPSGVQLVKWSFLSKQVPLATVAGLAEYLLPSDFGGAMEPLQFTDASGSTGIDIIKEQTLRNLQAGDPRSGSPRYGAVHPLASDGTAAQAWELLLYPTPDKQYGLRYRYDCVPPMLSDANQYPLGGPRHAETLLESCLAVAEEKQSQDKTEHRQRFQALLAASIQLDGSQGESADVWPVGEEPSRTLDLTYRDLLRRVAHELGKPWSEVLWSDADRKVVELMVQSGIRQFVTPPPLPREKYGHEWSFLRPLRPIVTVEDVSVYELPADVSAVEGRLTFAPGTSVLYRPIELVAEHQVREALAVNTSTGVPTIACIRPKDVEDGPTRYEVVVSPIPDDAYTIYYRCRINPLAMTREESFPPGGVASAEAILESCLAAAEVERDKKPGVHSSRFLVALLAAVSADRTSSCPATLGLDRDRSDRARESGPGWWHELSQSYVTYNGVTY